MALIDDIHALLPDNDVGDITPEDMRDIFAMFIPGYAAAVHTHVEADVTDLDHDAAIDARVTKTFVDALNVDADTLDGLNSVDFATAGHTHGGGGGDPLDAYPVGAIYLSVVSTSPATLFGGTWSAFAAGRMLVGINAGDADFDTVEETGGAKTHTLTAAQSGLPAHTHDLLRFPTTTGGSSGFTADTSMSGTPTAVTLDSNGVVGGAQSAAEAHPIMNPYIVVYMWKRTA